MRPVARVVDLSVPIYEGMPVDDLGPKFWVRLSHAASRPLYQYTQSREGRVFLTTDHVGTHLDGPLRFDPQGLSVERLPLDRVIRPARLLDLRGVARGQAIGAAELERAGEDLQAHEAAVLWTGHDRHLASPDYFWHRPRLGMDGAEWLVRRRAGVVAADFPGLGPPSDDRYEVKRALHRGGCLTVEQLTGLAALAGARWHLAACPLRIRGTPGSLVRAAALVDFAAREVVDLSLDIYPGMTALGGAVPTFWSRASHELTAFFYRNELSYQTTSMLLSEHAGTHIDSPYHFDPDGAAIEAMPLDGLLARARMLDLTAKRPLEGIGPDDLDAALRRLGAADRARGRRRGLDGALPELRAPRLHAPSPVHHGGRGRLAGGPPSGARGDRPGRAGRADRSRHARPQLPSAGGDPPAPGPDQPRPPRRPRGVRRGLPPEARRRDRVPAPRLRGARLETTSAATRAPR